MNSIYNIYEGLLTKTSAKVNKVSLDIFAEIGNERDSDLRKFFGLSYTTSDVFSVEGTTLICIPERGRVIIPSEPDNPLTDIIGNKFDCLRIHGATRIQNTNIGKDIYTNIEAESIDFVDKCVLDGLTIKTIPATKSNIFPNIHIDENCVVKNCTFEIDTSRVGNNFGLLNFVGFPKFENCSSKTIEQVRCVEGWNGAKFNNVWNNFFEFGYKLGYKKQTDTNFRYFKINSIDDIFALLKSKQFLFREYDQFPYKINRNLSDIIDLTKFTKIKKVFFVCPRGEIVFEKIDRVPPKESVAKTNTAYTLLQQRGNLNETFDDIPITGDGWRVVILAP